MIFFCKKRYTKRKRSYQLRNMKLLKRTFPRELFSTLFLCVLMVTVAVSSLAYPVYSSALTVPEKALAFLEDVAMLDMTKYNATLEIYDERYPDELHGLPQHNVVYTLLSDEGTLRVAFGFKNESFAFCMLGTIDSLLYSQPQPANIVDVTKGFLQRYQAYTGDPNFDGVRDFEEMRSILDTVDVTENVTAMSDRVKLEVINRTDYTVFVWEYALDGVAFPWMTLEFRNGIVCGFDDNWCLYTAGSTDINFSEEEAINIALDYVEDFSWTAGDEEVTEFEIIEEPRPVELITTRNREPLTLYPCWSIELYLDNIYPGNINRISLAIWADTGEVISCIPLGGGGGPPIPEFPSWTTIHIRSDGSVEGTDKIQRDGNVYIFISDINGSIIVEKDNIILDGDGFSLSGDGGGRGISLGSRKNVVIENILVTSFQEGIWIAWSTNNTITNCTITRNGLGNYGVGVFLTFSSSNNTIHRNNVTENWVGIQYWLSGNDVISENCITGNQAVGIWLNCHNVRVIRNNITDNNVGISISGRNIVYENNLVGNGDQVGWDVASLNSTWDNGSRGNFWSDYDGSDTNLDGIGDTPYIIDENNQDNYPLVNQSVIPEFPSWIILPLFLSATLFALILKKRLFHPRSQE